MCSLSISLIKSDRRCGFAPGADISAKILNITQGFSAAFENALPSVYPLDLLVGIVGAVIIRLIVYVKGKNAKKYRKGAEYGSARWGNAEDIKPYIDPDFQNNIILTQTERLTMNSRPKQPKYARNKNVVVIGGSGSGKTRFFVKPNLMQLHSSYVLTDPKGTVSAIVRGLDYYTKTVFEFVTDCIGAQGTVCGGGRYDGLIEELGGKHLPSLGFAMGMERLLMVMDKQGIEIPDNDECMLYIATMGDAAKVKAFELIKQVRSCGMIAETDVIGFDDTGAWGTDTRKGWIDDYESTRFTATDSHTAVITSEYNMECVKEWLQRQTPISEMREF